MNKRLIKKLNVKNNIHPFMYDYNQRLYLKYINHIFLNESEELLDVKKLRIHTLAKLHH